MTQHECARLASQCGTAHRDGSRSLPELRQATAYSTRGPARCLVRLQGRCGLWSHHANLERAFDFFGFATVTPPRFLFRHKPRASVPFKGVGVAWDDPVPEFERF